MSATSQTPPTTGGRRRGRPPIGPVTNWRLYPDQLQLLEQLAAHEHIGVNEMLRAILDEGLAAWQTQTARLGPADGYQQVQRRRATDWGERPYRS